MKLAGLIAVTGVLVLMGAQASADVVSKLRDCATFAVNETRLACYDKLALETPTPAPAVAPAPATKKPSASKSATADEVKVITKALKERMKDPESVRVRKIVGRTVQPGVYEFCGEINAKNSYGGYGGFKSFIAVMGKSGNKVVSVDFTGIDSDSDVIDGMCADKGLTPR